MNYLLIYENLCKKAATRILCVDTYVEKHHIVPRCMGGTDEASNLVSLTAEEHYLAHQLLVKIHPGNIKLVYAAGLMSVSGKNLQRSENKQYGWLKRKIAESRVGYKHSDETRAKMSESRKGKPHSEEWSANISKANKGKPGTNTGKIFSEDHRCKISESHKGKTLSDETKKKIKNARAEQIITVETKAKMSATAKSKGTIPPSFAGKCHSDISKKKISEANKGRPSSKKGIPRSEETKQKIRETKQKIRETKLLRKQDELNDN